MKKITLLVAVFTFILSSTPISAQKEPDKKNTSEVPKELVLSTLNGVSHLKLDNDQITKLMDYNKGFVDEVYEIIESDKEEKYKKKSLQALAYTRETDLREFLGKHKTNHYLKLMEDELRPLGRKDHRLKQIAKD
ncbi:hypothetical protein [Lutimonas sp.]|uniref:hypothetical protein n=1 Tax=Lutimonas sp. TaxID=1872403 RepID=UPI003D9B7DD3